MPQELALYPEFTVAETLYFFSLLLRVDRSRYEARMDFLLNLLDISSLKKRLVGNLSGGQKRRVSFAAALLDEPPLLILDEPTVGVSCGIESNFPLYRSFLTEFFTFFLFPPSRWTRFCAPGYGSI